MRSVGSSREPCTEPSGENVAAQSGRTLRVAMAAAERSGDQLASLLLGGMQARWPSTRTYGIGGPQMQALGFEAQWSCDELSVRGLVEALWRYRHITGIRRQFLADLTAHPPDVFVGVDASDFNLPIERTLRQQGVPVVQLVCPSIWAWRPERVQTIRESVAHIFCLYPFEPALLAEHGLQGTFVGHPVADVIDLVPDRQQARRALGLPEEGTILALLPGSRPAEIRHLLAPFVDAARRMQAERPELLCVLPTHEGLRPMVDYVLAQTGMAQRIRVVMGQSHTVQAACDVAIVASGTATLETALHKRPMVIAYRMQWLSWRLTNGKRLLPWVGLPNILCNEGLVPEFLQDQVQGPALAQAALAWLDDPARVHKLAHRFEQLHMALRQDMPNRATQALAEVLGA